MAERSDTPDAGLPGRWAGAVWHSLWRSEFLRSLGTIAAVILVLKGCVIDQYTVPSSSMHPTLQGNDNFLRDDRILVNKWIYGPRVPFTSWRLWRWGGPERWDIVVFKSIQEESEHDILVKRVVGLPGETVRISDGKLHVNGEVVEPPESIRNACRQRGIILL